MPTRVLLALSPAVLGLAACSSPGAALDPLCDGIDCSGHGLCVIVSPTEAACVCDAGFAAAGLACEAGVDACTGVDCDGHGLCVVSSERAVCLCGNGFVASGASCVESTSACAGVDCSGHGACLVTAEGGAVCLCYPDV